VTYSCSLTEVLKFTPIITHKQLNVKTNSENYIAVMGLIGAGNTPPRLGMTASVAVAAEEASK
jgi:hypothetical protein